MTMCPILLVSQAFLRVLLNDDQQRPSSACRQTFIWLDRPNPLDGYVEVVAASTRGVVCINHRFGEWFRSLSSTFDDVADRWEIMCLMCSTKRPLLVERRGFPR